MTHDLFVSYAHADNAEGWVTFLRDALVEDHAQYRSGEVLDPFFDTHSIHHMDDWEHHILRGLQESRLFLAVLSPAWFKSGFCRRELREYLDRRVGFAASGEGALRVGFIGRRVGSTILVSPRRWRGVGRSCWVRRPGWNRGSRQGRRCWVRRRSRCGCG